MVCAGAVPGARGLAAHLAGWHAPGEDQLQRLVDRRALEGAVIGGVLKGGQEEAPRRGVTDS